MAERYSSNSVKSHWTADGHWLVFLLATKSLLDALSRTSQAKLMTQTADPDSYTAPVLKTYTKRFGAATNGWIFLAGTEKEIAYFANDRLKFTAAEKKLVGVDKQAWLRGVFETSGEGIERTNVQPSNMGTVRQLQSEP